MVLSGIRAHLTYSRESISINTGPTKKAPKVDKGRSQRPSFGFRFGDRIVAAPPA